ncbi:phosphoserine aminotransferase [Collibacillus ludicampi]|uniref:Phosphoserine aminotransferase n=1 Tax=Collibacillus ludicampi TaxID=2771369 RepID=A0AAV4LJI1_9BACL|nr:3-phosphoserine/phosphohydroxythreonine transaminase [Collibacillus ludicampi]GIM47945.1 phosphoserine aminotransferase [Collibacillus ludicampi]
MLEELKRAKNFNAGPSALPLEVLQQAQQEIVDFKGTGMSIMEMSHRSKTYEDVHNEAQELLRELMGIPENYHILFLQGGASLQFSMIPMNFLQRGQAAGYVLTGSWSEKALKEAQLLGETFIAASTKEGNYRRIPSLDELQYDQNAAYLHITTNNTIFGTEWSEYPDTGNVPLIADMSSDILSRPIDVSKFALIYAGAQKNLGPSGVTLVIIRDDLVERGTQDIPTMLKYSTHAKNNSLYNTPPTFGIYMLGLVAKWVKQQGGVEAIYKRNLAKAQLIYDVIDASNGFYLGHAEKNSRSLMNITFRLKTEELEKKFLEESKQQGFVGLNGHRSVGGCRASTYNPVPVESCIALKEFMEEFQKKNG